MHNKFFLNLIDTFTAHKECAYRCFSELGLSEAQPKILYILHDNDGVIQRELAEKSKVSAPTLKVILDKMVRDGLVRKEDTVVGGKKACSVFMTDLGKIQAQKVRDLTEDLDSRSLNGFTEEEIRLFYSFMDRVRRNLDWESLPSV